jgi:hypothetical protein
MTGKLFYVARMGTIVLALIVAFCLGFIFPPRAAITADIEIPKPNADSANIQTVPPTPSSLAGDERAIPIQKDMLATLKQIDAGLGRIENQKEMLAALKKIDSSLERIEKLLAAQQSR